MNVSSIRIFPFNRYKYKELSETAQRKFDNQSIIRPAELSSLNGRILIPSPNEPSFPQNNVEIGTTWIIPILNLLGEIQHKIIPIDENQIVSIQF
ncbi:unnamed protein product [Rotaria socialis]|uniref:Uncharacterized protein n=1 Tax=Rotaria socialis TaxID=392032 RepID=A0A817R189_9BILA|nr:unnamed protein product [Rotaria socialis]CAF3487023.1 unnamed protein product [Rotaria socialis]CAF4484588.1 unnamed protein product [Rotaria socialis]CAF4783574.1 unnamed protein product [Rotaria socialis]